MTVNVRRYNPHDEGAAIVSKPLSSTEARRSYIEMMLRSYYENGIVTGFTRENGTGSKYVIFLHGQEAPVVFGLPQTEALIAGIQALAARMALGPLNIEPLSQEDEYDRAMLIDLIKQYPKHCPRCDFDIYDALAATEEPPEPEEPPF